MLTSEGKLCSLALSRIGIRKTITALDGASAEAQACDTVYVPTRNALLAMFPWSFATKRAELAVLADAERSGWEFVYALPIDCVTARHIYSGMRTPPAGSRVPFTIEHDAVSGVRVLLTDREDAELIYTMLVTKTALFSPLFDQALAWRLAAELALNIPGKLQLANAMEQSFARALAQAGAAEFRQSQEDQQPDSEFVRER